jgi:hypothetical protein
MRRLALRAAGLMLVLTLALALGEDVAASASSDEQALKDVRSEIVSLIGEPRCANLVHCRVLALGARPCGGPSEYLAFSSLTAKREILEAKAYEYSFLEEEVNRSKAAVGSCEVLPPPHATCVDGRCTLSSPRR